MKRLLLLVVGLGLASPAVAGPRDVAALKSELKRLEGVADRLAPLAAAGDAWCESVPGEEYVGFARDVGVTSDTAKLVFKGKKRLLERMTALRRRLRGLDEKRRRCNEVDRWNADRRVLVERASSDSLGAVDELRMALDRWKSTFTTESPPEFEAICRAVLTSALSPSWPPDWRKVDPSDLRMRSNVTRVLPECGSAAADAGRELYATRAVVRDLSAATEAEEAGDPLGAEEILDGLLRSWPENAAYPPEAAYALRKRLQRVTEFDIEKHVESCRAAPESCAFAETRNAVDRLAATGSEDAASRSRLAEDLHKRLDGAEVGWVRTNRQVFGAARSLRNVESQLRWIEAERPRLRSRIARTALDAWKEELDRGSMSLRKQRISLLGGTDVRLEGATLCDTNGVPLGDEWGPRGETQARIRRFLRELRDSTGLREPKAVLRATEQPPGTKSRAQACDQVLIVTAELTSCAVDALWEPELPSALDRHFGQISGPRLRQEALSPLRALMPAEGYSLRLKNRSGRTFMVDLDRSGTRSREYLDGTLLNPHGTEAVPVEYVDVMKSVLGDVRPCP